MRKTDDDRLKALEIENRLLRSIIDNVFEGVYATNKDGEIIVYNDSVEMSEGMKREDVLGKKECDVYNYANNIIFHAEFEKQIMSTKQPVIEQHYDYQLPNGQKTDILFNTYPFYDQDELLAIYTIGYDLKQVEFIIRALDFKRKIEGKASKKLYKNGSHYTLDNIIGSSDGISTTVSFARKVASHNSPVLIYGETGTGKELFAQGIHNSSLNSIGPFIAVNCSAIPENLMESLLFGSTKGAFTGAVDAAGLFEQAEGGTLFLDEINSMPIFMQPKLLRTLQDKVVRRIGSEKQRPINCRIISATNVNPALAIKDQQIRQDLYYRLAVVTLYIPPLRERKEDIKILVDHFIDKYNDRFGLSINNITEQFLNMLKEYDWPGNVRELENMVESAMNFIDISETTLKFEHLPTHIRKIIFNCEHNYFPVLPNTGSLHSILQDVEKRVVEETLRKNNGNVTKSAQELGIIRQALHYRIRKLGINCGERLSETTGR